jgi:hypothetical protein
MAINLPQTTKPYSVRRATALISLKDIPDLRTTVSCLVCCLIKYSKATTKSRLVAILSPQPLSLSEPPLRQINGPGQTFSRIPTRHSWLELAWESSVNQTDCHHPVWEDHCQYEGLASRYLTLALGAGALTLRPASAQVVAPMLRPHSCCRCVLRTRPRFSP